MTQIIRNQLYTYIGDPKKYHSDLKARRLLRSKRSVHEMDYCYRLGYNMVCAYYTGNQAVSKFSGSSLNRKKKIYECRVESEILKIAKAPVGETINDLFDYGRYIRDKQQEIADLLQNKKNLQGNGFGNANLSGKHELSVHMLSQRSKGKIRDKCQAFYRSIGREKIFCTLTFISETDDKTAQIILNKFLTTLRSDFEKLQYLWCAESQENGNIHFHLIINRRLPIHKFNALWVLQQYNAGLRFYNQDEQFEIPIEEIKVRYDNTIAGKKTGTIQEILNPVDVKKIKSINSLSGYLTKYITKGNSRPFNCLAWHCSRGVSRIFTKTLCSRSTFAKAESFDNCLVDRKTGEILREPVMLRKGNLAIFCYLNAKENFLQYMRELETVNKWIMEGMLPDKIPEDSPDEVRKFFLN